MYTGGEGDTIGARPIRRWILDPWGLNLQLLIATITQREERGEAG